MTRPHGALRGLKWVNQSSLTGARFGRMFRWLPGETYEKEDLTTLAAEMIQLEHAKLRVPPAKHVPENEKFEEGPDIVSDIAPLKLGQTLPTGTELLDTQFGTPEPGDENPAIPAGYTYFGQFIDHDLTFDPNSSLQKQNDPDATEDFRTPRFDLDSLYGRGPDDQPYLYQNDNGNHFLLGRNPDHSERKGELPRNVDGRALIGDPRNDENDIICQLQTVFLNFHNKVVDTLHAARPALDNHALFQEAQRIVRWHYQYLVLNDYLPRVVGHETWHRVFVGNGSHNHPKPRLEFYKPNSGEAYMPVEFSVAAFRFGHSMIRPSYALRPGDANVGGSTDAPFAGDQRYHRIPIFSELRGRNNSLNGFGPLFSQWEIDWNLFFSKGDLPTELVSVVEDGKTTKLRQVKPGTFTQPGYRIDSKLVDPLAMLPPSVAKSGNMPDGIPVLAYRNLLRGSAFELPSGQNVARALGITPLSDEQLWSDAKDPKLTDLKRNPFAFRAPLWFYLLKESAHAKTKALADDGLGGHHLGPVGGRIVAEVLVGIAHSDHSSYLYQDPTWTPAAEKAKSGFQPSTPISSIFELIHWTTNGTMTFLP